MHYGNKSAIYVLLVFLMYFPVQAGADELVSLKNGQHAFNLGNYALSFALWQTQALQGDSDAQLFVGLSYANGWGVHKDMDLASVWYRQAALNNNPSAQLLLGLYYFLEGEDNRSAGLKWLTLAAEAGDQQARDFLAKGYPRGWFSDIEPAGVKQASRHSPIGPLALANTDRP